MATRPSARSRTRPGGPDDGVDPALPQKKRARHRLVGAIALGLVALVVVPLLLESEPTRPADISVVIPSRDTPLPARAATDAATEPRGASGVEPRAADARGAAAPESKGADARAPETRPGDARPAEAKGADARPEPRAADAKGGDAKSADGRAADAKGAPAKSADAKGGASADPIQRLVEQQSRPAAGSRYLLQVGAYGGESGAAGAVEKVRAAGLSAFTEKIKTDRGERVRVRVGPFADRDAAEQARAKLKAAGIEAALIAP